MDFAFVHIQEHKWTDAYMRMLTHTSTYRRWWEPFSKFQPCIHSYTSVQVHKYTSLQLNKRIDAHLHTHTHTHTHTPTEDSESLFPVSSALHAFLLISYQHIYTVYQYTSTRMHTYMHTHTHTRAEDDERILTASSFYHAFKHVSARAADVRTLVKGLLRKIEQAQGSHQGLCICVYACATYIETRSYVLAVTVKVDVSAFIRGNRPLIWQFLNLDAETLHAFTCKHVYKVEVYIPMCIHSPIHGCLNGSFSVSDTDT